jgi:positive regulator of sigma E activity
MVVIRTPHEFSTAEIVVTFGRLFGLPIGTLVLRAWARRSLRAKGAPAAIEHGAAHLIFCGGLWAFVLLHLYSGDSPAGIDILAMLLLVYISPALSLFNITRLADDAPDHPRKRQLQYLSAFHLAALAILVLRIFLR